MFTAKSPRVATSTFHSPFSVEPLEPRRLCNVAVEIGVSDIVRPEVLEYFDADGTRARITSLAGAVSVVAVGDNLSTHIGSRDQLVIDGLVQRIESVNFINSSADSELRIKSRGGGDEELNFGTLTAIGAVGNVKARDANFDGDISLGGIDDIEVNSITNSHAEFGNAGSGTVNIRVRKLTDSIIDADQIIDVLNLRYFKDTEQSAIISAILAAAINRMDVAENFDANLFLSGSGVAAGDDTLGKTRIGDAVGDNQWQIQGTVKDIRADRFGDNFILNVSAHVDQIQSRSTTGGRFGAGSIRQFKVGGDFVNARVSVFDDLTNIDQRNLGSLDVKGDITGVNLFSDGGLGKIVADALRNANLFTGVDFSNTAVQDAITNSVLPDPNTSIGNVFNAAATIDSIKLASSSNPSIENTRILAYHIGKADLGKHALVQDNGNPYGFLVHDIGSFKAKTTQDVQVNLKDIPVLGSFFSRTRDMGKDLKNLVVFVTPQVVEDPIT